MVDNGSSMLSLAGECVICFEPFSEDGENEPHLLSCGHTFCLKCIRGLVREEGGRHVVACPSCRTVSVLTNGPPFLPPKNFQLAELIANIRRLSASQQPPANPSQDQQVPGGLPPTEPSLGLPPSQSSAPAPPQGFVPASAPPQGFVPASAPPQGFTSSSAVAPNAGFPSAPPQDVFPSAPPADVAFAMYTEPEQRVAPPPAATAAASTAGKQESEATKPVLESERELELTPEEQRIYDTYSRAVPDPPPDFSLQYHNAYHNALFLTVVQNPGMGYPRGRFQFCDFKVGGWEVPALVREWIKGRWVAPKGFAGSCLVHDHFSRVLVPHAVFNVSMTAILTADETYRPPNGGRTKHSHIREQFVIDSRRNFVCCSAMSPDDRKFYDEAWGRKWSLHPVHIFDPETDLHLIVPPDQWPEYEFMTMKKKVFKEREKKSKGFFGSLFNAIVGAFKDDEGDTDGEHAAPPTDVYILPGVRPNDLWDIVRAKCQRELENNANSRFAALQSRSQEGYTYKNKNITFMDVSYNSYVVYMPVYSGRYDFTDENHQTRVFRIAVNAQNGDVQGDRPSISVGDVMKNMFGWLGFGKKDEH